MLCRFKPPHTDDPMRMLIFTMIAVPSHYRLVIFLDSLDQLSSYGKVLCECVCVCACVRVCVTLCVCV